VLQKFQGLKEHGTIWVVLIREAVPATMAAPRRTR
jgi:hypothetical protein